jgi:hypothetical protein
MAFTFIFPNYVLIVWVDVRIEVENGGVDVMLKHPLDDGGRAGCTTSMEEHFVKTVRDNNVVFFLHAGRAIIVCTGYI